MSGLTVERKFFHAIEPMIRAVAESCEGEEDLAPALFMLDANMELRIVVFPHFSDDDSKDMTALNMAKLITLSTSEVAAFTCFAWRVQVNANDQDAVNSVMNQSISQHPNRVEMCFIDVFGPSGHLFKAADIRRDMGRVKLSSWDGGVEMMRGTSDFLHSTQSRFGQAMELGLSSARSLESELSKLSEDDREQAKNKLKKIIGVLTQKSVSVNQESILRTMSNDREVH